MTRRYTAIAAVAVPDERYTPIDPARVVVVTVLTDGVNVWHCYPEGDCHRLRILQPVSKPTAVTGVKPSVKPAHRRRR